MGMAGTSLAEDGRSQELATLVNHPRTDSSPRPTYTIQTRQRRESEWVGVGVLRADPPLEHHAARAGHGQQLAVPRGLRRVGRQPTMRAVVAGERLKVGEQ